MKRKKKSIFKITYLIYIGILAVIVAAALLHVNSVLDLYENEHPQRHLENAVTLLKQEAENGTLWQKENVPSMESGIFEPNTDQKAEFVKKLNGELKFSNQKWINDNECTYSIISDDTTIAEVKLRKSGDPIKKLEIISIQKYELVSYVPINHTYTLELPADVAINSDIFITVNGIELNEKHGEKKETGETVFTLENLYSAPRLVIKDTKGNIANYRLPDDVSGEIEYDNCFYTLTLPDTLSVSVNGENMTGETLEDGRIYYRIRLAAKAEVMITDLFGNTEKYNGSSTVPLTYYTFTTSDKCTVKVDGKDVPEKATETSSNPEYENFASLTDGLPGISVYNIVVLKDNAEITITDSTGTSIAYDPKESVQDLTDISLGVRLDTVPEEVAKEVNVLDVLEDWSLFMSCDLNFASLSKHLVRSSYQYNVAYKYNTSIDRTFTSNHSLCNPPFVEESVTNFVWLTDDCFSVDIRFVKQMWVLGAKLDDEMNERCYFVKYDDTNDRVDNPKWKLVGMKEIVDNAE